MTDLVSEWAAQVVGGVKRTDPPVMSVATAEASSKRVNRLMLSGNSLIKPLVWVRAQASAWA